MLKILICVDVDALGELSSVVLYGVKLGVLLVGVLVHMIIGLCFVFRSLRNMKGVAGICLGNAIFVLVTLPDPTP